MPDRPGDMDERDVDARFASIVAQWEASVPDADEADEADEADDAGTPASAHDTETPDDPVAGDEPDQAAAAAPPARPLPPWVNPSPLDVVVPASAWRTPEPMDAATERAAAEADEAVEAAIADEEPHFEPPEVVLPPQEDLSFWGAVIGLVAGPLMLLYVVFARPFHSTRWFVAAVVVSLLGFGLLVMRQPAHRDPTSGDDGARV
ncbi:MAG TPA: hypothetical protein VN257_07490 [Actinotalea sp.]|nr:hypothetical protein [Actinotalea sp.]